MQLYKHCYFNIISSHMVGYCNSYHLLQISLNANVIIAFYSEKKGINMNVDASSMLHNAAKSCKANLQKTRALRRTRLNSHNKDCKRIYSTKMHQPRTCWVINEIEAGEKIHRRRGYLSVDINYRCGNLALSHTIPVHLQTKVVCGAYQVRTTGSTKKKNSN